MNADKKTGLTPATSQPTASPAAPVDKRGATLTFKTKAVTAAVIILTFFCTQLSAEASPRQHHRDALILGTGVAILGAAVIGLIAGNDDDRHHPAYTEPSPKKRHTHKTSTQPPSYRPTGPDYKHRHTPVDTVPNSRAYRKNHPETVQTVWVAPVYRKVWVPGYYNRRNHWVKGYHDTVVVKEGYWKRIY